MKFIIASDIHGSEKYCKMLLDAFEKEKADRMLLLGDILYHGPRNDLPENYAPKKIIEMLNPLKRKLICVRGNCDTEVDQMVLDFPILADYCIIPIGDKILYASHGHKFSLQTPPPLNNGDILINGHTHIPACENNGKFLYLNCGSVSIPKENSAHSYMTLENGKFLWKNLENGTVFNTYTL